MKKEKMTDKEKKLVECLEKIEKIKIFFENKIFLKKIENDESSRNSLPWRGLRLRLAQLSCQDQQTLPKSPAERR